MPFHHVSDWCEASAQSTKGTRDKLILANPDTGDLYFLKFPMVKPGRDYTPETWSEIIAYQIGTALGFNVLKYELAEHNGRIGCISKNMIVPDRNETLIEGHSILSSFAPDYDPSDKDNYKRYSFSFVRDALIAFQARDYINEFIRILLFDAIIGNSDRHQSNWGIIQTIEIRKSGWLKQIEKRTTVNRPAPIYDSGCCLGREFSEEQIIQHLNKQSKFDKYIRNGLAELRIETGADRTSHDRLIQYIRHTNCGEWSLFIESEIKKVITLYDQKEIKEIITNIDCDLPDNIEEKYRMSLPRKEFVFKLIDTRVNNLKNLLQ